MCFHTHPLGHGRLLTPALKTDIRSNTDSRLIRYLRSRMKRQCGGDTDNNRYQLEPYPDKINPPYMF